MPLFISCPGVNPFAIHFEAHLTLEDPQHDLTAQDKACDCPEDPLGGFELIQHSDDSCMDARSECDILVGMSDKIIRGILEIMVCHVFLQCSSVHGGVCTKSSLPELLLDGALSSGLPAPKDPWLLETKRHRR